MFKCTFKLPIRRKVIIHVRFRWNGRHKSFIRQCLGTTAALHVVGNVIITGILLSVAYINYPGGTAIQRLHRIIPSDSNVDVYIDNAALQSGVTRFTEINNNWKYNTSKAESDFSKYSHLMIEAKSKYSKNLRPFFKTHDVLDSIEGFSHLHINYQYFPPFKIKTKPILTILQRKDLFGTSRRTEMDEILEPFPEESTEDVETGDEFQLVNGQRSEINQSKNFTGLAASEEINVNWKEAASMKLPITGHKGEPIALSGDMGEPTDSNKSEQESNNGDFLGESDEGRPPPTGTSSKHNSRINKSAMKMIRSKTNNVAFDALQDALQEDMNKVSETQQNQLVMMMPLASSRRKFIMPNVDAVTNKPGESPRMKNTEAAVELPSEEATQRSIEMPTGRSQLNSNSDAIKHEKPSTINHDVVQYNPKSIQLAVLNQNENSNILQEPTTAIEIPPVPSRPAAKNTPRIEPPSEDGQTGNAVQLYGTKSPPASTRHLKLNVGNKDTNQRSVLFIWFPEDVTSFKEQKPDVTRRTQPNENSSANQIPETTPELARDLQGNESGNTNKIPSVTIDVPRKKEENEKTDSSDSNPSNKIPK